MSELKTEILKAAEMIKNELPGFEPEIGIILGTGLGGLGREINISKEIEYEDIPGFPVSTVETHSGKLLLGEMEGKKVAAMSGRFHIYEGYTMKQVVFPVRVMKELGIKYLLISNACGGINPSFKAGEIAVIEDVINFMGDNPLIGANDNSLGPRWPDMFEPLSKDLIAMAHEAAKELNIKLNEGVYIGVTGPNLETRAEYRMMGAFADMVGMSTVPEIITGVHCGLKMLGLSVVTDECAPESLKPVNIDEILKNAASAEPKLTAIMKKVISRLE
ncbi:MAG TPA: purine-nucleoside phosphorylase [Firmicutes bacterium]|nr:purine-nucleoside phosphorylase [Bacillota bacterium]